MQSIDSGTEALITDQMQHDSLIAVVSSGCAVGSGRHVPHRVYADTGQDHDPPQGKLDTHPQFVTLESQASWDERGTCDQDDVEAEHLGEDADHGVHRRNHIKSVAEAAGELWLDLGERTEP
jgi:hypothetical protein